MPCKIDRCRGCLEKVCKMTEIKDFFKEYGAFVDGVTSDTSKSDDLCVERIKEISTWLNGNYARMDAAMAGLAGEAGECIDLWKKLKFHNKDLNEESRQKMIDELSDVCWYLTNASIAIGADLDDIIRHNVEKLKARHPHGFSSEYLKYKKD